MQFTKRQLEDAWEEATGMCVNSPLYRAIIGEALEATEPEHEQEDIIDALETIIDDILAFNGRLTTPTL